MSDNEHQSGVDPPRISAGQRRGDGGGITGCGQRTRWRPKFPIEFDGSKFQLAAPEPNPKSGGVLRCGILKRPPHFDFHQSGTIGNLGAQGCMFDNLIRHDPRDSGKTIIPDLAHSWEIPKDGKTYTFLLRKGVQFHDGAELTADDVKATFDRIPKPPQGVSIPRSILFKAVSEINAPTSIPCSSNWRRRARKLHHGGDRQRLERASCARRRSRTTITICGR